MLFTSAKSSKYLAKFRFLLLLSLPLSLNNKYASSRLFHLWLHLIPASLLDEWGICAPNLAISSEINSQSCVFNINLLSNNFCTLSRFTISINIWVASWPVRTGCCQNLSSAFPRDSDSEKEKQKWTITSYQNNVTRLADEYKNNTFLRYTNSFLQKNHVCGNELINTKD